MRYPLSIIVLKLVLKLLRYISPVSNAIYGKNYDIVLCYHDVSDDDWDFSVTRDQFESHLSMLNQKFEFVSITDLLSNDRNSGISRLAITFDDGYESVYMNAFPIAKYFNSVATVFVLEDLDTEPRPKFHSRFLDKGQMKELLDSDWEIGFHTKSHKDLSKISMDTLESEILDGKKELENILNTQINYFSYPYGHYNDEVVKFVKNSGFKAAFTVTGNKFTKRKNNMYRLSRITVSRFLTADDLIVLLSPAGLMVNALFTYLLKLKDSAMEKIHE